MHTSIKQTRLWLGPRKKWGEQASSPIPLFRSSIIPHLVISMARGIASRLNINSAWARPMLSGKLTGNLPNHRKLRIAPPTPTLSPMQLETICTSPPKGRWCSEKKWQALPWRLRTKVRLKPGKRLQWTEMPVREDVECASRRDCKKCLRLFRGVEHRH